MHQRCLFFGITCRNESHDAVVQGLGGRVVEGQAAVAVLHIHVGAGADEVLQALPVPGNWKARIESLKNKAAWVTGIQV